MKRKRIKEPKPVKVDGVEEWEVEKILNKWKIRKVMKYLVWWKGFTAKNDTWEREKDLKNAKELVDEFKERMKVKVRQQKRMEKMWRVVSSS